MRTLPRTQPPGPRLLGFLSRPLSTPTAAVVAFCAVATSAILIVAGCYVNPATGKESLSLYSTEQEVQMGRQANEAIQAQLGFVDNEALQQYVDRIGQELVTTTERRDLPWTFHVVDDPTVNAFALPGGFIYVTRGILAHMENEAELASVLGHEIGHVTARHSVNQMSKQQLAQLGLVGAAILEPDLQKYGQLISAGLGLMFLKFSRDDERQADLLGLRYMYRGGYDPREMDDVFAMLDRVSQAQGGGSLPNWLSTHPSPEDRIQRIGKMVDTLPQEFAGRSVGRNEFLRHLDGMVYGTDPREGYFRGNTFIHPDLRFRLDFPAQWETANQKQSVVGVSPNQDAILQVGITQAQSPSAAAQQFVTQQGINAGAPQSVNIGGLSAATANFTAQTQQGQQLSGTAAFIGYNGKVYQLLGYSAAGQWSQYQGAITGAITSFGPVTDQSLLDVEPRRIEIITTDRPMTIDEFARAYPSDEEVSAEELAILNSVEAGETIPAGTMLKRVTPN